MKINKLRLAMAVFCAPVLLCQESLGAEGKDVFRCDARNVGNLSLKSNVPVSDVPGVTFIPVPKEGKIQAKTLILGGNPDVTVGNVELPGWSLSFVHNMNVSGGKINANINWLPLGK